MQTQHAIAQLRDTRRSRQVAAFVLLALATLQFAIGQHASAHAIDDLGETCTVCVQLDDNVNAPIAALPTGLAPQNAAHPTLSEGRRTSGRSILAADGRGPPNL